jgi:ABC-2 type transport system permease protein
LTRSFSSMQAVDHLDLSVAGERERRTLETLLASRLDERAILFGKLLAARAYGWGLTLLSLLLGAASVSLAYGTASGRSTRCRSVWGCSAWRLPGGLCVARVGVLISAHVPARGRRLSA